MALTLTIVLLVAACGDSASDPGATTSPTQTDATAPTGGDDGGLPSAQCLEIGLALSQAGSMGMTGQGSIDDSVRALEAMAGAAPPEIAADFVILASALGDFAAAMAAAGVDLSDPSTMASPEAQQALTDASAAFEASGADEAGDRIGDYLDEVCET